MDGRRRIEPTFGGGPPPLPPPLPLAEDLPVPASDFVVVRQKHIRHERQLKSVGLLFGLAALVSLGSVAMGISYGALEAQVLDRSVPLMATLTILGLFFGALAYGYRTLRPWVKYVGTPVSCLGLFAVPVGTLLHGYILYLIWCGQGQRILQPDYAAIIRSTPDVRYKATTGDKVATVLLILLVVGLVATIFLAT
ncbi:hypothetical protein GCM10011521_09550 [Arenimonas soli]|uniref:Uncharacterized protein n=1 Tax=Arenimonas soli TaxID=2269504 RepID=A0ABQ1HF79_9GAMM|nr:hypothetical protein [Arenimonas soli]GGA73489.1 hypothetical protein GCM10011521_09550 [Arenimonas soli]